MRARALIVQTHEVSSGENLSNNASPALADQRASDAEIEALQRSVKQLRQQLDASPQYLGQTTPLRP